MSINFLLYSALPPGMYTFLKNLTETVFQVLLYSCIKYTFLQSKFPSKISLPTQIKCLSLFTQSKILSITFVSAFLLTKTSDFPKYFQINFASLTTI